MTETIITNAKLVLENEVVDGTVVFDTDGIRSINSGRSHVNIAIDADGDYVSPGLVEMHTDNIEKHIMPRPGVFWPDGLAAALAHDCELAGAGITTVYDSISAATAVGDKAYRRSIFSDTLQAVGAGVSLGVFRISHFVHVRCELSGDNLIDEVEPYLDHPLVRLASLMDHTPGQRQWRNLEDLKRYSQLNFSGTDAEYEDDTREKIIRGPKNVARSLPPLLDMLQSRGIPIATHDDTTEEDVRTAHSYGAVISEFPTTIEAARLAHAMGVATIAGAPNIVRGGSHSSGVSAGDLVKLGILDGISSDYVPASLLQAVSRLVHDFSLSVPDAMAMVTWKVADMVSLTDRGRLQKGLRADLLRFRYIGRTPQLRGLWCGGRRVL